MCLKCGVSVAQRAAAQHNGIPPHTKWDSSTHEVFFIYVVREWQPGSLDIHTPAKKQQQLSPEELTTSPDSMFFHYLFVSVLLCKYNNQSLQA